LDSDAVSSNSSISSTIVDAKGDLIAATANDAVTRLGVGADDTVLMARASEPTGLVFAAPRLAGGAARPLLTAGARLSGSGLVLGGISSNFASTPDAAALDIVDDMELSGKLTMPDWTPTEAAIIVSKEDAYRLQLNTGGTLAIALFVPGFTSRTSSVSVPFSDGDTGWVKVERDTTSVRFYTSTDGINFTQLGTSQTAVSGSTASNSSDLKVGARGSTGDTSRLVGTIHRATVLSGVGGTAAFDADFETATADALAFTESSTNAATVTINTTRYTYGIPGTVSGALTTGNISANNDRYQPFTVQAPITVDMVLLNVTTGPSSASTINFGIYALDNNRQPTGNVLVADSISVGTSATGVFTKQFTAITLQPGAYALATNVTVQVGVRVLNSGQANVIGSYGASDAALVFSRGRASATFGNDPSAWNAIAVAGTPGVFHYALLRWSPA